MVRKIRMNYAAREARTYLLAKSPFAPTMRALLALGKASQEALPIILSRYNREIQHNDD